MELDGDATTRRLKAAHARQESRLPARDGRSPGRLEHGDIITGCKVFVRGLVR
jgi:hypothetical protein